MDLKKLDKQAEKAVKMMQKNKKGWVDAMCDVADEYSALLEQEVELDYSMAPVVYHSLGEEFLEIDAGMSYDYFYKCFQSMGHSDLSRIHMQSVCVYMMEHDICDILGNYDIDFMRDPTPEYLEFGESTVDCANTFYKMGKDGAGPVACVFATISKAAGLFAEQKKDEAYATLEHALDDYDMEVDYEEYERGLYEKEAIEGVIMLVKAVFMATYGQVEEAKKLTVEASKRIVHGHIYRPGYEDMYQHVMEL